MLHFNLNQVVFGLVMLGLQVVANSVAGAEFTVINQSGQKVRVCTIYYRPFSEVGAPSGILVGDNAAWISEGHWSVRSGDRVKVYSGKADRIYVRMTFADGTVVRPSNSYGTKASYIHPTERFWLEDATAYLRLKYDANLGKFASVNKVTDLGMLRKVDGFYLLDANSNFTVSRQAPAPNPAPQPNPNPVPTTVNISGKWRDLGNQLIDIKQSGTAARADAGDYPAWNFAEGTVKGDRIEFMHYSADRRPLNGVTGVVKGNRIEWDNNTTWTREAEPAAVNLRGNWRDLGSQRIRITQSGTAARADAGDYPAWNYAEGTVKGDRIEFMHYSADRRPLNGVTGVVKGNRIEWDNNTTWTRE